LQRSFNSYVSSRPSGPQSGVAVTPTTGLAVTTADGVAIVVVAAKASVAARTARRECHLVDIVAMLALTRPSHPVITRAIWAR
jgi:hypothetical protein